MTTISWHVEKHNKQQISAIENHNLRHHKNYSNENIDKLKSFENITDQKNNLSVLENIDKKIAEDYSGKRAPRKDAIFEVQHTFNFGGDEWTNLPKNKQEEVIKSAISFITSSIAGENNVLGTYMHFDETSPHAHLSTIPLTKDGRLSAKELYSRNTLQKSQNGLLSYLKDTYPELHFERLEDGESRDKNVKKALEFNEQMTDESREEFINSKFGERLELQKPAYNAITSTFSSDFFLSKKEKIDNSINSKFAKFKSRTQKSILDGMRAILTSSIERSTKIALKAQKDVKKWQIRLSELKSEVEFLEKSKNELKNIDELPFLKKGIQNGQHVYLISDDVFKAASAFPDELKKINQKNKQLTAENVDLTTKNEQLKSISSSKNIWKKFAKTISKKLPRADLIDNLEEFQEDELVNSFNLTQKELHKINDFSEEYMLRYMQNRDR